MSKNTALIDISKHPIFDEKQSEYRIYQYDNRWIAVDNSFIDINESLYGFGITPDQALNALIDFKLQLHEINNDQDIK